MNAENPSMSKFSLVTQTQLPHRCLSCGRNADGRIKFLDFGLSLDVEDPLFIGVPDSALGVVYICEDCGREAAALLGCLPAPVAEDIKWKLLEAESHTKDLEKEIERLRTLNESYTTVLRNLGAIAPNANAGEEQGDSVSPGPEQGPNESGSK